MYYVNEGDVVKKNELLASIDDENYINRLNQAKALYEAKKAELLSLEHGSRPEEIKRAKAQTLLALAEYENALNEFERRKNLVKNDVISKEEYDKFLTQYKIAKEKLKSAVETQNLVETGPRYEDIQKAKFLVKETQAALNQAIRDLNDTKLYSPVDGVMQTRVLEKGDYANVGEPVYTIALMNPIYIRAFISEKYLGVIHPGMKAKIKTDSGKAYIGYIGYISPVAEFTPKNVETKEVRTDLVYRTRIVVEKHDNQLLQGMPVTVEIILNRK
nr:HlyD family efflux transporter periplasmic adaptor subunit [Desulfurella sp.]